MVATPRDAATLILLRNSDRQRKGIEVLMLRRNAGSAFLPGAYVFPGGTVDPADCMPTAEGICRDFTRHDAQRIVADAFSAEKALGFFVAAIREAFEEAGILMACKDSSDLVTIGEDRKAQFADYRRQVREAPFSFATTMEKEGLELAAGNLFYFSHWITPEIAPIRFDTCFFVAEAPPHQDACHDALETTDSQWIAPRDIIERRRTGELNVAFPTFCNIKALVEFSRVAEVIESTRGREVPAIQPLLNMLSFG